MAADVLRVIRELRAYGPFGVSSRNLPYEFCIPGTGPPCSVKDDKAKGLGLAEVSSNLCGQPRT